MNYSLKGIEYNDLLIKLNEFLHFEITNKEVNLQEIEKIKKEYLIWENDIENLLTNTIEPKPEILIDLFLYTKSRIIDNFEFSYDKKSVSQKQIESLQKKISSKKTKLKLILDYISITDSFIGLKTRTIIEVQDKIDFLLEKLRLLFNDNFYSIKIIFDLNAVEYRIDEPKELAENLHKRNHLIKKELYLATDEVKISIKGASYIERKIKSRIKLTTKKSEDSNLNFKIDNIISKLNELGYGQEVIFNELEELRELQTKLPKKTWGQLLKGKLVDLAYSEIISKETAIFIFEHLTSEHFKILK